MGAPATLRARMGRTEPRARHALRLWWQVNRCNVDMGPLGRGLGRDDRDYERVGAGKGTLMRHFSCLALSPSSLPRCMPTSSAVAQLVPSTGAARGLAPADLGALTLAIPVAAVTVTADAHPLCAARNYTADTLSRSDRNTRLEALSQAGTGPPKKAVA
jgi:hypothetical protein